MPPCFKCDSSLASRQRLLQLPLLTAVSAALLGAIIFATKLFLSSGVFLRPFLFFRHAFALFSFKVQRLPFFVVQHLPFFQVKRLCFFCFHRQPLPRLLFYVLRFFGGRRAFFVVFLWLIIFRLACVKARSFFSPPFSRGLPFSATQSFLQFFTLFSSKRYQNLTIFLVVALDNLSK